MFEAPYADARGLVREALQLLLPPTRETVDEYALNRLIPNRAGTGYEPWAHETFPPLVGPMRSTSSLEYLTVCLVGPGGCGKTAVAENALLHAINRQPRNFLWYMQNEAVLEAHVKTRINTMLRVQKLTDLLADDPTANTLHFKNFVSMWIEFLSANYGNLISKRAPFIVLDEVDAFDPSLGDVKVLADVRRARFGPMSMLLAMSHPDRATGNDPVKNWQDGIMKMYADSTRRIWVWPCAECGRWSSPAPFARRAMKLDWPHDETLAVIEREAHLLCPVNGCKIRDKQIPGMNLAAYHHPHLYFGYLGEGQSITEDGAVEGELIRHDTDGFYITGVQSPFNLKGIGGLARELAKAELEYEVSGDETSLKEVTVKQVGYLFESKGLVGSIDAQSLAERAEGELQPLGGAPGGLRHKDLTAKGLPPFGTIPEGVRFLTAWMDIQATHFEVTGRGWGENGESWVILKDRIPADTSTDVSAWMTLLEALIGLRIPLSTDPARGMSFRAIGYDSQGSAGVWDRATDAWRRLRQKGLIRNYGTLDGRDVWSVVPTQGAPSQLAARLQVVYPDNQKKDKKVALRGTVPIARFNANQFKDNLRSQLKHMMPGAGYVHFPAALRSKEPPHVNFEQLVSERRNDAKGTWEKEHSGVRNEFLDMMVGTHVLAHLHGLARIVWTSPPPFADVWERNNMIVRMDEAPGPGTNAPGAQTPRRTIGDALRGKK